MTTRPRIAAQACAASSELLAHMPLLVAGTVCVGLGLAGMTVLLFGVFAAPVTAELGWSLAFYQLAGPLIMPPMMLFGPIIGSLADRFGARAVAVPSLVLFGVAMASLGLVNEQKWTWILGWLAIGLTGCGTCGLVWAPAITARFDRQRGVALAIVLSGSSIVGIAGPSLASFLIGAFGWRLAYVALGAIPILVAAPVVAALTRPVVRPGHEEARSLDTAGATLGEALHDHRFWLVAGSLALVLVTVGGMNANLVPILISRGHTPTASAALAGILGGALIAGNLATGTLLDRFTPHHVCAAMMALPALCMPLLLQGSTPAAMVAIALLGIAAGAEFNLVAYLCGRIFGKRQFGRIYAFMIILPSLSMALGGPLLGLVHDRTGSFDGALAPISISILLGAVGLLFVRTAPH